MQTIDIRAPDQIRDLIFADKEFRLEFFRHSFRTFFAYHFGWEPFMYFHNDWVSAMETDLNILIKGFRGSRKTTIVRAYVAWAVIYGHEPYIIVQSFVASASAEWVMEVARMLMYPTILKDYGSVFPTSWGSEDVKKRSASNFESSSGVKVESTSIRETIRGANTFSALSGHSQRPTLYIGDDLDTDDSTKNPDIIDQIEAKLVGETWGAMDQMRRRRIVLGNAINEDGQIPRLEKERKNDKGWLLFDQALMEPRVLDGGTCQWPGVFTPEVVSDLRRDGEIAFTQNYLCLPAQKGGMIIRREWIRYYTSLPPKFDCIVLGVDPSTSQEATSDPYAIVVTGHIGERKYVLQAIEVTGSHKTQGNVEMVAYGLYLKWRAKLVRYEAKSDGQKWLGQAFKKRGMVVELVSPTRDKAYRLTEHQADFEFGNVFFNPDDPGCEALVKQLVAFPNVRHDDLTDGLVHSLTKSKTLKFLYSAV